MKTIIEIIDDIARLNRLKEERRERASRIEYDAAYYLQKEDEAIRELEQGITFAFEEIIDSRVNSLVSTHVKQFEHNYKRMGPL